MDKVEIRHVEHGDKTFWSTLDKHISSDELDKKIRDKQGYVLLVNNCPAGILRYNLFWDNTPFCTLLYVDAQHRLKGFGAALMQHWENEMLSLGYDWLLVSTQSDEDAQHFYRKLGYCDCGALNAPNQAEELFLCKYTTQH